ncbi:HAD family phosphatase [Ferrimonas pelagia]|uniref:HAD family phosphatase n=1 Tax=Ferrimonas pelagia TaxID=1177826 RepID=A0ABP9F053_9GAMM
MSLHAVLFDMDGLIFNTEAHFEQAWQHAATLQGRSLDLALYRSTIGMKRAHFEPRIIEQLGPGLDIERYRWDRDAHFHRLRQQGLQYQPGFEALFEALGQRGIKRALVTSSHWPDVEHNFAGSDYLHRFDTHVCGDSVQNGKPAPDCYLLGCEQLAVAPGQTLALEDSNNGMRAAIAAGCRAVMVPDRQTPADDVRRHAHALLPSLADVLAQDLLESGSRE